MSKNVEQPEKGVFIVKYYFDKSALKKEDVKTKKEELETEMIEKFKVISDHYEVIVFTIPSNRDELELC
jgi:hypothetical protein